MRLSVAVVTLTLLAASAAHAQSASDPSLAFTITGGLTSGQNLWNVDRQLLTATATGPSGQPVFDTVNLGRRLRPGIVATLAMSLYRSPHWGMNFEIGYFGLGSEEQCRPAAPFADGSQGLNQQACTSVNGRNSPSSVIGFLAGGTLRFLKETKVQPYLRLNGGVGLLGNSFVETIGIVLDSNCASSDRLCPYTILSERKHPSATPLLSIAGGFIYYLGPGYRVRMEGRDLMMMLPVVQGPAAITGTGNFADTKMTVRHVPMFTIGLDVMLERQHTRRY